MEKKNISQSFCFYTVNGDIYLILFMSNDYKQFASEIE